MHKVIHYRDKCIGCGVCYEQQPQLWRMSHKDGKATLIRGIHKKQVFIVNIAGSDVEETRKIAEACPVNIIKVI